MVRKTDLLLSFNKLFLFLLEKCRILSHSMQIIQLNKTYNTVSYIYRNTSQNYSCKHLAINQSESIYNCFPRRTGRLFFFSISLSGAKPKLWAHQLLHHSHVGVVHGSCLGLGINSKLSRKCGTWGFAEKGRKGRKCANFTHLIIL